MIERPAVGRKLEVGTRDDKGGKPKFDKVTRIMHMRAISLRPESQD